MATTTFLGAAEAVAQVATASIDSVDGTPANNTFTVTIGGVAISQVGDTDVATTAAALVVLLEASTHPYFAAITWTNPSAGNITGTADTAGVPFTAALTETGAGSGSVTDFSDDTACTGPNFWDDADNWSEGSVPGASDDVHLKDSAINICWALDQNSVTVGSITIHDTYTGRLGLNSTVFATSADGTSTSATQKAEYRDCYLKINPTTLFIGVSQGVGSAAGSGRILIDTHTNAANITVYDTANVAAEAGKAAVRLRTNSASAKLHVKDAPGGVFLGTREDTEDAATIGDVTVSPAATSRVILGVDSTCTTWRQSGGRNRIQASVTTATATGGELVAEGAVAVTTMNVDGAEMLWNSTSTVTTLNLDGGLADFTGNAAAKTITAVNHEGGTFKADAGYITVTNYNEPQDAPYSLTVAA